jgi:hypothetical protein
VNIRISESEDLSFIQSASLGSTRTFTQRTVSRSEIIFRAEIRNILVLRAGSLLRRNLRSQQRSHDAAGEHIAVNGTVTTFKQTHASSRAAQRTFIALKAGELSIKRVSTFPIYPHLTRFAIVSHNS